MEPLEFLWHLQQKDLSIADLEKSMQEEPLIFEEQQIEKELSNENSKLEKLNEELKNKQKELKKAEMNLQKASDEVKDIRKKLYGGEISKVKEVEQYEKKLELLEKDKEKYENQTLEYMEIVEELEEKKQEQTELIEKQDKERRKKRKEKDEKLAELKRKKTEAEKERDELAAQIDEYYLEKYNSLRQKVGKRAISRVVNDICEGCRVLISSSPREKLYNPNLMVYCENCGRLLVKFQEDRENKKSS